MITAALFTVARWAGLWAKIKDGASWVFARRDRALAAIAILLGIVAWWQHHEAAKWATQARHTKAAWDAARRDAEAAKAKAEKRYKELATHADQTHAADVAQGDARLAAYIASHRMRPAQTHPASPAQGDGARIPEVAPTETVLAEVTDLKVCDMNYSYALAAHEWAMKLEGMPHD